MGHFTIAMFVYRRVKKRKRFVCFTKNHQDRLQSGPTSGLHMLTNTYGDMTAQIGKTGHNSTTNDNRWVMLRVSHPKSWGAQCSMSTITGHLKKKYLRRIPCFGVVEAVAVSGCVSIPSQHNEIMVSNLGASINQDETPIC